MSLRRSPVSRDFVEYIPVIWSEFGNIQDWFSEFFRRSNEPNEPAATGNQRPRPNLCQRRTGIHQPHGLIEMDKFTRSINTTKKLQLEPLKAAVDGWMNRPTYATVTTNKIHVYTNK